MLSMSKVVAQRELLDPPCTSGPESVPARLAQHAGARIEAHHGAGIAEDTRGRPRHEAGARRHVEQLHAGAEPGSASAHRRYYWPEPKPADAPPGRSAWPRLEQRGDERGPIAFGAVVVAEDGMRRRRRGDGVSSLSPSGGCRHGSPGRRTHAMTGRTREREKGRPPLPGSALSRRCGPGVGQMESGAATGNSRSVADGEHALAHQMMSDIAAWEFERTDHQEPSEPEGGPLVITPALP